MALVQRFTITENQAGTITTISDATGAYDVTSNPTGYGAPNTERTNLALIIIGKYKASIGDTELTFDAYNPETVTSFTVSNLTLDGYYQYNVYPVPKSGTEPGDVLNTFRYDFATDQLERYNGATWIAAEYTELQTYSAANVANAWPHIPQLFKAKNYLNKLLLIGTQLSVKKTDLQQYLMATEIMVNGGISLFGEGSYTTFQEEIEKYQSRVDTILELT